MKEYVVRNKNIFMICTLIAIVITIVFYASTTYAIVDGTVYTRDELSEIIQNQDNSISELDFLINSNYNAYNIYVNNEKVDSLTTTTNYYLDSYTCQIGNTTYTESNNVLNWNMGKQQLTQANTLKEQMTCDLYFYSDSHYTTTLAQKIYNDNQKLASRTDFSTAFTDNTTGKIYYTSTNTESVCDNGDTLTYVSGTGSNAVCKTYFFAGNPTNNFVKYGDQMWRIVRINEDQSVRLIFAGLAERYSINTNSGYIGASSHSYSHTDNTYVGYMHNYVEYNPTSTSYEDAHTNNASSSVKIVIENWFGKALYDYRQYVSQTAIYCNDRSISSGLGYGKNITIYAAYSRIVTDKTPQFKCPDIVGTQYGALSGTNNNKFTVSSLTGNAKLGYGVAELTADEAMYAGAIVKSTYETTNNYIYTNAVSAFHLMSPRSFVTNIENTGLQSSTTFRLAGTSLWHAYWQTFRIRPVLSLKSCVKYANGDGTENSPYEVIIDSACASAIN